MARKAQQPGLEDVLAKLLESALKATHDFFQQRIRRYIAYLAGLCILLGICIDIIFGAHLSRIPITSNLIAGLLGLPAAFLIVDIAANRALNWDTDVLMSRIRRRALKEVKDGLRVIQPRFRNCFSVKGPDVSVDEEMTALKRLKDDLAKAEDYQVTLAAFAQADVEIIADTLSKIQHYGRSLERQFQRLADGVKRLSARSENYDPSTVKMLESAMHDFPPFDRIWTDFLELDSSQWDQLVESVRTDGYPKPVNKRTVKDFIDAAHDLMKDVPYVLAIMQELDEFLTAPDDTLRP